MTQSKLSINTNLPLLLLSHSAVSNSLWPHGVEHTRLPCPWLTLGVCSNSCLLSRWCHRAISSLVAPFFSCLQSFPASGSFQWVHSSHQVAKVSELQLQHQSFQVLTQSWFHLGLTGLISLLSKGTLKSLLQNHNLKASILWRSAFFMVQLSHSYMTTGKTIALTRRTFVGKVMSLLLNRLSRLVITFLPRSKRLLISWLQSPSAVILEPPKIKSDTVPTVSPSISHEVMGPDAYTIHKN